MTASFCCWSEFRLYETEGAVAVVPTGDGAHGALVFDRSAPGTARVVDDAASAVPPPAAGRARRVTTIHGIVGLFALAPGDVRLAVVTARRLVGGAPLPLWRVAATSLVRVGVAAAESAGAADAADVAEYERLLGRALSVPALYYATEWDATRCTQARTLAAAADPAAASASALWRRADPRFFWNSHLVQALTDAGADRYVLPMFMGFADVRSETVAGEAVRVALVTRRSRHRAGLRLFARGADDFGNVANFCETEQIVVHGDAVASFVQVRGSIPVLWTQLPDLRYKPPPTLAAGRDANAAACKAHLDELTETYGTPVVCLNLVDQKGKELVLANEYAACAQPLQPAVRYIPFDFHRECKKGRTERLSALYDRLAPEFAAQGYFFARGTAVQNEQHGVFRNNCIDCLDRTNVSQSLIAKRVLAEQLRRMGVFHSDAAAVDDHRGLAQLFKCLWADNGDAISVQYSGTSALKRDITRTGKRTARGLADDGVNALTRYWKNNFSDGDLQDAYSLFLGNFIPLSKPGRRPSAFLPGASKPMWAVLIFAAMLLLLVLFSLPRLARNGDVQSIVAVFAVSAVVASTILMTVKTHGRSLVNNPRLALHHNAATLLPEEKKVQ